MSCFGGPVDTPNLDALAAAGLRYTRYHSASSGGNLLPFVRHRGGPRWSSTEGAETALEEGLPRLFGMAGYATLSLGGRHVRGRNRPAFREMIDEASARLEEIDGSVPAAPFYIYLAPGSMHGMRSIPSEWVERYRGRFSRGWEVLRRATLVRQRDLGLCAAHDEDERPPLGLPRWSDMVETERRVARRVMELFAAGLSYVDDQLGRLLSALARSGRLEETLIVVLSREGLATASARRSLLSAPWVSGWRWAARRPSPRTWSTADCTGADPLIIHWPDGLVGGGAIRRVQAGLVDIPPTLLEVCGIDAAFAGEKAPGMGGRSFARSFWQTELIGGAGAFHAAETPLFH